ncbi:hypothetical protein [Rhodovulum sulfidophilum]|uniref:hypothetical protein n=1 Tax=Rhodovulum sulfidophilum TaxID=35806 RepID=UPI00351B5D84
MAVSEEKQLKALKEANAKLKKLRAEQMPDLAAMREPVSKLRRERYRFERMPER